MLHVGEIDGVSVCITDHALARMVEMGLTPEEIRVLILTPEETYTSRKYPNDVCHRHGEYSLALIKEGGRLIVRTALYATLVGWMRADREGRLPANRQLRLDTGIPKF